MNRTFDESINQYLKHCKSSDWVRDEAYKFEFANFVYQNVNWDAPDKQILDVLLQSQKIKYTSGGNGIQFIQVSGREKLSEFVGEHDVALFREIRNGAILKDINWQDRTMSYPALSAWIASLMPEKFYPIPQTGFHETIGYLFHNRKEKFPKRGLKYIQECQPFMEMTKTELIQYPIEEMFLPELNQYYRENPELNVQPKDRFDKIDWNWVVQDFHLFVYRKILGLYKNDVTESDIQDEHIGEVIEGESKVAIHKRYERKSSLVKKVKSWRINKDPFLQCEVCGFSFLNTYGDIGKGFIEAHHLNPLSERDGEQVTKQNDISLVCSNCHIMLHRGDPVFSIEELKKLIEENRK